LGLGVVTVLTRERLSVRIRTPEDLKRFSFRTISTVSRITGENGNYGKSSIDPAPPKSFNPHLISSLSPLSPVAESYRNLRTNLQCAELERPLKSVMVTSANPSEGKSTTVANLAIIFSQAGKKVLLVDADVHRPILHKFFDRPRYPGLSEYILGKSTYDEVVQKDILDNLDIICCGTKPPNPAELPGSKNMKALIKLAMGVYDVVLLDSPPVLSATGASILAKAVDGTVLVVSYDNTRAPDIESAMESLVSVGATVLGVLLNNFDARKAYGGYAPSSSYGYGYAGYVQDAGSSG
jgi:capsular exopolysaccharide synthesis family protein